MWSVCNMLFLRCPAAKYSFLYEVFINYEKPCPADVHEKCYVPCCHIFDMIWCVCACESVVNISTEKIKGSVPTVQDDSGSSATRSAAQEVQQTATINTQSLLIELSFTVQASKNESQKKSCLTQIYYGFIFSFLLYSKGSPRHRLSKWAHLKTRRQCVRWPSIPLDHSMLSAPTPRPWECVPTPIHWLPGKINLLDIISKHDRLYYLCMYAIDYVSMVSVWRVL